MPAPAISTGEVFMKLKTVIVLHSPERAFARRRFQNRQLYRLGSERRYWLVATARIVVKAFPLNRNPNALNERPLAVNWIDPEIPAVDFHKLATSKAICPF